MSSLLRILSVTFDTHLEPWELPQFRGAVAHKVGLEYDWYHNHNNEDSGYHYRYPLIQYKLDRSDNQSRPLLMCLHHGVDEAHHFFSQPDWNLSIHDRDLPMRVAKLDMRQHLLSETERPTRYRIHRWKPFNPDNYNDYRQLTGIADQFALLERLLTGHILAFARGVDWQIETHFQLKITDMLKRDWVEHKGVKVLAFTIDIETNLSLPQGIGLGKGVSTGFGRVQLR